jgi:hypothetical protein
MKRKPSHIVETTLPRLGSRVRIPSPAPGFSRNSADGFRGRWHRLLGDPTTAEPTGSFRRETGPRRAARGTGPGSIRSVTMGGNVQTAIVWQPQRGGCWTEVAGGSRCLNPARSKAYENAQKCLQPFLRLTPDLSELPADSDLTEFSEPAMSSVAGANTITPACWICGGPGDSGEHKTKRSDLKAVFGLPTQQQPLFFHDRTRKNRRAGSLDAKLLKSPGRICQDCNSTRTQPHDRAWGALSKYFRVASPSFTPGAVVRPNRVFPYDTRRQMLNVHQFFVKAFGCLVIEGSLPIDISGFADAIMNDRAHPLVHLKFGVPSPSTRVTAGRSDVWTSPPSANGRSNFISWFYDLPHVWVLVMFAAPRERRDGLVGAWHPSAGTKTITLADFRYVDETTAT